MKKLIILGALSLLLLTTGCESMNRFGKSIGSNLNGGLKRKITIKDNQNKTKYEKIVKADIAIDEYHVIRFVDTKTNLMTQIVLGDYDTAYIEELE